MYLITTLKLFLTGTIIGKKNEKEMVAKYHPRMYRIWLVFLAWSVLVGEQGTSQCYQIVCNKNLNEYDRNQWRGNDLANYLHKFIKRSE